MIFYPQPPHLLSDFGEDWYNRYWHNVVESLSESWKSARGRENCYWRNYTYIYACTVKLYIFKDRLRELTVLRHGIRHLQFICMWNQTSIFQEILSCILVKFYLNLQSSHSNYCYVYHIGSKIAHRDLRLVGCDSDYWASSVLGTWWRHDPL